ncbi:MAG: AI-2E family transporter, partial [bacterium]
MEQIRRFPGDNLIRVMQENQPDRLTVTLQTKTVKRAAKWTLAGLLVLGLLAFLPVLGSVLTLIVTALFLAFLLDPVVNVIENRGLDRLWAVAIVFVGIICLGIVAFQFLVPAISEELHQMSQGIKSQSPAEYIAQLQTKLGNKIPILSNPEIQEGLKTKLETLMNGLLEKSISLILNLFSAVVSFIMIAFITFFFLKDGRRIKKAVVSWVPNRYFEMSLNILHKTSTQLGRYLRGQLLVAFIVGTLSVIA